MAIDPELCRPLIRKPWSPEHPGGERNRCAECRGCCASTRRVIEGVRRSQVIKVGKALKNVVPVVARTPKKMLQPSVDGINRQREAVSTLSNSHATSETKYCILHNDIKYEGTTNLVAKRSIGSLMRLAVIYPHYSCAHTAKGSNFEGSSQIIPSQGSTKRTAQRHL
jgi:hypothetical protein